VNATEFERAWLLRTVSCNWLLDPFSFQDSPYAGHKIYKKCFFDAMSSTTSKLIREKSLNGLKRAEARREREQLRIAAAKISQRAAQSKAVRAMLVAKARVNKFSLRVQLDDACSEAFHDCFPVAEKSVSLDTLRQAKREARAMMKLNSVFAEQMFSFYQKPKYKPRKSEPTVFQGAKALAKMAVTAARDFRNIPQKVDEAAKVASTVADFVGTASSAMDSISSTIKSIHFAICKYFPIGMAGILLVAFIYWLRGSGSCPNFVLTGIATVVAAIVGEKLWASIKEFFEEDVVQEQSAPVAWLAPAVVSMLCVRHMTTTGFHSYRAQSLVGLLGSVPRASAGVESIFEWTVKAIETVVNKIREWMSLPSVRLCTQYSKEVDSLLNRVDEFEKGELAPKESAERRYTRLKQLLCESYSLRSVYRHDREIQTGLNHAIRALSSASVKLKSSLGVGCGYTQLPVSIALSGAPGVGKTMMIQSLVLAICKLAGIVSEQTTSEEISRLCFIKPFNSEYMEGYCGQPVYLMDDFMMKKATPQDTTNGLLDLMTYYSSFPAVVNMAACENKGMVPFDSRIILMTSNMKHLDQVNTSQVMMCPEALKRRVDLQYDVMVKPEYRIPGSHKLDYDKFQQELIKCEILGVTQLEKYPWHVWEIFASEWDGKEIEDSRNGSGTPFIKLILEAVEKLKQRKESHHVSLRTADIMLNAPVETPERYAQLCQQYLGASGVSYTPDPPCVSPALCVEQAGTFVDSPEAAKKYQEDAWSAIRSHTTNCWTSEITECEPDSEDEYEDDTTVWEADDWLHSARDRCKAGFKNLLKRATDFWQEYGMFVKIIAAGIVIVGLISSVVMSLWNWVRKNVFGHDDQIIHEQSNRPTGKFRTVTRIQAGSFREGNHIFVYNNSFKIIVTKKDGTLLPLGVLTFTHEDYCVMPLHFKTRMAEARSLGLIDDSSKLMLRGCRSGAVCVNSTVGHFLAFPSVERPERDLLFMRMPAVFTAHKDIRKFIIKESELPVVSGEPGRLDTARTMRDGELVPFNERVIFMPSSFRYSTSPTRIGRTVHRRVLEYNGETIEGDCGSPFCLTNSNMTQCRVWLGLHIGLLERSTEARATAIDIEVVNWATEKLRDMTKGVIKEQASFAATCQEAGIEVPEGFELEEEEFFPFEDDEATEEEKKSFGSFTPVAKVSIPVNAPVCTSFVDTFISAQGMLDDVFEYDLRPMELAPFALPSGEFFFPMVNALKPYAGDIITIDLGLMERAVFEAARPFSNATVDYLGRVWTVREAFEGANGAKGIPLGTSVGLPGCIVYKNKRDMLGGMMDWDFDNPKLKKLMAEVEALEAMLKRGVRPYFLVRGFLKDETRKPGKFARYIAGTNVHYYALCRMYFGQIVSCQMKHYKKSGMCPGINPYRDWGWLKEFLQQVGDDVWDGDFTGFDTSQQPQMLKCCLKFINSWYYIRSEDKEQCLKDNAVREILFEDLIKSKHLVGKGSKATHVVQWQRSLPSGHFLTTFINSLLSASCVVAAYIKATGRDDFWAECRVATLGDDNVTSVAPSVVPEFNQRVVARVLKEEFGMIYTAGRKGEELQETVPWEIVSFLQRTFAVKNDVDVGPIALKSILGCLMHMKKATPKKMKEVFEQNIECVLTELALHDEDIWKSVGRSVLNIATAMKYVPRFDVTDSRAYFDFACSQESSGWF
jgi:hypothetical protein